MPYSLRMDEKRKAGRPPSEPGRVTYVRIPEGHREVLHGMSAAQDRPIAAFIRDAVAEYIERRAAAPAA